MEEGIGVVLGLERVCVFECVPRYVRVPKGFRPVRVSNSQRAHALVSCEHVDVTCRAYVPVSLAVRCVRVRVCACVCVVCVRVFVCYLHRKGHGR